ncbi:unnamed protein product [Rotaria sp. Silwood2]|nr:unnamed protein product [Rotaria sp. Silwood2]CAF4464895.1 unnamed protein product [Rotaria sp. Silwood2]
MGGMPCCVPLSAKERVNQIYIALALQLPAASLMDDGTIKLEGAQGLFNPKSLPDPSWLKGKMTPEEYYQEIDLLNKRVTQPDFNLKSMLTPMYQSDHANLREKSRMNTLTEINQRHPSICFTYQATEVYKDFDFSSIDDSIFNFKSTNTPSKAPAQVTILYIFFD